MPTFAISSAAQMPFETPLQRTLARQIAGLVRSEGMTAGTPLNQLALAEKLGVSRTPVRAALKALGEAGLVRLDRRGVVVANPDVSLPIDEDDRAADNHLIASMARDRHMGALAESVSEADLMRRYDAARTDVVAALRHLASLGVAERKPGFGWRFLVSAETTAEKRAAYRFRLAIEPAALREPGYVADPMWISKMQAAHRRFMTKPWRPADSIAFFEMNAAFHLGLVTFSGNRFFIQATQQQNDLRRLRNYSWRMGEDRVRVSSADHLSILDALASGKALLAADRLTRHLSATAQLVAGKSDEREALA
jgi:DNA-binding GntR family transcriptional regulator